MSDHFEIESVISLGGLCQVAYQIERRFGFRINSPFDWLVTPLESINKILKNDGADFSKSIKVINNGGTAVCMAYGVAYQHDFVREEDSDGVRRIIITSESIKLSRNKMLHKYGRFLDLMSQNHKTLFIRMGGHHDSAFPSPYCPDPRRVTTQDLNLLCEAIERKFPALSFRLAFVYIEKFTTVEIDPSTIDKRVDFFNIDADVEDHWMGEEKKWKNMFDSYCFSLKNNDSRALQFGEQVNGELLHG